MHLTTCILTLLFLLSVRGAQVAKARVRFARKSYTVLEAPQICVEVINDMPLNHRFTVDFTFSGSLLGIDNTANTRQGTVFFRNMETSSQACIEDRMVDNIPCEADIRGTITLSNNSEVLVISPGSATIIVKDDDALSASFGKSVYFISEGDAQENLFPFVNTSLISSAAAHLSIVNGSDYVKGNVSRSLIFTKPILADPLQTLSLSDVLVDDDIALEDAEHVLLEVTVNVTNQQCVLEYSPYRRTTILVSDDDDVRVQITQLTGRTREGEDYRLCVSTTKMIARNLRLSLKITTGTADLVDIEQSSDTFEIVLRAFDYDMMECIDIPIVQDNVVEQNEVFSVAIKSSETVPASLRNHLHLDTSPSVITIQDTSTCIEHTVGSAVDDPTLYVFGGRTLCFTCRICESSNISWEVTSFEGNEWTGVTGGRLHSRHNLTDQGVVYSNGTLLITNSSTLFSKRVPANISFTESGLSKLYRIILGDSAAVISLDITIEGNSTFKIVCKFRGNPQPSVEWIISNSPINDEDRIETVAKENYFQSTLTIKSVKTTQYACKVINKFGEDFSEGFIVIGATTRHSSSKKLIASASIFAFTILMLFLS